MKRRNFFRQLASLGAVLSGAAWLSGLGRRKAHAAILRPPGALPEEDFAATCIRCLRCVDACPNQALFPLPMTDSSGVGGTPTLHPRRAACMLCLGQSGDFLKCTEVCPSGALRLVSKAREEVQAKVKIGTAAVDLGLCYSYNNWSCGACYRACPLAGSAMTLGTWERPIVHAEACVGCGLCERACIRYPHAIRVQKAVES